MPRIYIAVAIVVALLLSGCAESKYWVPKLRLPPDATETTVTESTIQDGKSELYGRLLRMQTVGFDIRNGWVDVRKHFNEHLPALGFIEASTAFDQVSTAFSEVPEFGDRIMYTKQEESFIVVLFNMAELNAKNKAPADAPGFRMHIIQTQ